MQSGLIPEHWTADGCLHPGQSVTLAEFLEVLRPGYAARRPLPAGAVADQAVQAGWIDAGADLNGVLTRAQGAAICALVLVCAVAIAWLAGRIYRMMSLYKGNPPSIQKALRMIREN